MRAKVAPLHGYGACTTRYTISIPPCVHLFTASRIVPSMTIIRVRMRSYHLVASWSPPGLFTFRITGLVHRYFRIPPPQVTHCTVYVVHLYYISTRCTKHLSGICDTSSASIFNYFHGRLSGSQMGMVRYP
jgi:hypothetical protein